MTEPDHAPGSLQVFGALLMGFAQACINLNIVAGKKGEDLLAGIVPTHWYPFERLRELEQVVLESYQDSGPIMERVGIEMMTSWYKYGPGRSLINNGVDFLSYQTGAHGIASVIKGPVETVGDFALVELTEGHARVRSTTPMNRDLERGVLIGGMMAPGDLDFVDVDWNGEDKTFTVEYH
ncbi:MAG: hypothetical protein H6741_29030 [Alphaproteobacteria bacterium]|nr:hypothetical protein [Alphaproteobacteria bacterium]